MVNTTEAQRPAADGWVVEVMPNMGQPVTNWLVVGPFYESGPDIDRHGVPDWMFDDEGEALSYARQAAEDATYHIKVVVYPADPIG